MKKIIKTLRIKQKSNSNSGFSLVEVLCAIVLIALVATPILQVIIASLNLNLKSRKLLAAADITSGVMEFTSSLVFDDYEYKPDGAVAPTKVYGLNSYYWGGDTKSISSLALNPASGTGAILYPHGPSCEYLSITGDTTRVLTVQNVKMDGFIFDVKITMTDPESSEAYYVYSVQADVYEHGSDNLLSTAQTKVANSY